MRPDRAVTMQDGPTAVRGMAALVTLAEAGSFSSAADRLGITPSAMSKLVARLEDRLGTRLVQRTTRKMQLTEAGVGYAIHARRILEDIDTVDREIQSRDPRPRGTLRVTAPAVLGHVRVLPVVIAFQRENPDVKVRLDLSDRVVDMVEEGIDVAVRMMAEPPLALVARKLDDDARVLCARPDYLERRGHPRSPDDLSSHECIVFAAGPSSDVWRFRCAPKSADLRTVQVSGRLSVGSTLSLRDAALGGLGIADLPRYLVEDDLRTGKLVSVLPRFIINERSVFALYAPSPFVPTKVRAFVEALRLGFRRKA